MMLSSSFPDTVPEPQGDPKLGLPLNQQLPWKGNGGVGDRDPGALLWPHCPCQAAPLKGFQLTELRCQCGIP